VADTETNGDDGKPLGSVSLSTGQVTRNKPTARDHLHSVHTPRHELAADIVDDLTYRWDTESQPGYINVVRRDDYESELAKWKPILQGPEPTPEVIENLRKTLQIHRLSKGEYVPCPHLRLNEEDMEHARRLLECYRSKYGPETDLIFTETDWERTSEDELRTRILWHHRNHNTVADYEARRYSDGCNIPFNLRKVFAVDFYESRGTDTEGWEVHERTQEDGVDQHYATWQRMFERVPESTQRRCAPCRSFHQTSNERVLHSDGTKETGEGAERKVCDGGNGAEHVQRPRTTLEGTSMGKYRDIDCCTNCVQCKEMKRLGQGIPDLYHHTAHVRVFVSPYAFTTDEDYECYAAFEHHTKGCRYNKNLIDEKLGTIPYWREHDFYAKITEAAMEQMKHTWPIEDFILAGMKYRLTRQYVKYEAYDHNTQTYTVQKVFPRMKVGSMDDLPPPRHVTRSDRYNIGKYTAATYGGRFDVILRFHGDAEKARLQRITYADDALAKRIKQIIIDKHRYGATSDLHTLGALIMTCATWQSDDVKDYQDPIMKPYPRVTLADALGPDMKTYKKGLQSCRDTPKAQEQSTKRARPTSLSIPGPQEDTQPSDADPSGTQTISPRSTKGMSKRARKAAARAKAKRIPQGAVLIRKPTLKERLWNTSQRQWNPPSPSTTHTARMRPISRERQRDVNHNGGNDYSESQRDARNEMKGHQSREDLTKQNDTKEEEVRRPHSAKRKKKMSDL
jgi:hypothetical protein